MADPFERRGDRPRAAVAAILLTVLSLSLGDALIKPTSGGFVIWQIFVIRSALAIPLLLVLLPRGSLRAAPSGGALGWAALRSAMPAAMWVCCYLALPHMTLGAAAAAYYTLPLWITLFAGLLLGDRIGARGWLAVALGFVGALLILRPGAGLFGPHALLPLAAAVLYAGAMIITRARCRSADPLVLSLALNLAFVVIGAAAALLIAAFVPAEARQGFLLAPWTPMDGAAWLRMGLLAASFLVGGIGAAFACRNGPPAVIGTFDLAYVGFAVIWGALIFGERPDAAALAGMALVAAGGALALRR